MLCALALSPRADLVEVTHSDHKALHDFSGALRFIDYPWDKCPASVDPSQLILSYHNFEHTPDNLEQILEAMQRVSRAKFYKIATMTRSSLDALKMLLFMRKNPGVIGICMGELGHLTRILGPVVGCPIMYTSSSNPILGQIPLDVLLDVYHFHKLNMETPLYGLIGDPVSQSPGHLYHNLQMQGRGVYVKIPLKSSELSSFFQYARELPFQGLSVTIPHKEAVVPFLDEMDEEARKIGAVNTICFTDGKLQGYNTDGRAALQLMGQVKGKKVFILGAGGAARAVAYTATEKGAEVTIWNRTRERAQRLAEEFGCSYGLIENYDILVNTTPLPMPIKPQGLCPGARVIDLCLKTQGGLEVYFTQAELQRILWKPI
jgi:3-dehydroquinate dehydratase/shikimate dehydrogenase